MSDQSVRCVALDFDLTLFDYARPQDTTLIVPWLEALASRGVRVGIASGRSLASLRHEVEAVGMIWGAPFPAFVIEYECLVRDGAGETLAGAERWNETNLRETEILSREAVPLLQQVREDARRAGVEIVRDILVEPGSATICLENPSVTEEARLRLVASLDGTNSRFEIRRNHHILIVAVAGRNKGAAVRQLQVAWGLSPQEVLVVGDSLNDLPMMTGELGFRCATVGNADPQVAARVRERGGFVAPARITRGLMQIFAQSFGHIALAPDVVAVS